MCLLNVYVCPCVSGYVCTSPLCLVACMCVYVSKCVCGYGGVFVHVCVCV